MSEQRQNDLLDFYPDLSDQDEEREAAQKQPLSGSQPRKVVKTEEASGAETQKKPNTITTPLLFGGKHFLPPPPPPGSKKSLPMPPPPPSQQYHNPNPHYQTHKTPGNSSYKHPYNQQNAYPFHQRQRKNCIYVKNIPKQYNQVDKLMTFFKNEGMIKEIKVNNQEASAMVRFVKEENALRFINSKKAIFNRSFIIYSLNEKEIVSPEFIKERENEEAGKIKKPLELLMKEANQKLEALFADKIRAILFCLNHLQREDARQQLQSDLNKAIEIKNKLCKYSYEELEEALKAENQYDWNLSYLLVRKGEIDKKHYTFQLQKKFGPVSSLEVTLINPSIPQESQLQGLEKSENLVKLQFLGPKQAWNFYYLKHRLLGEAKAEEEKEVRKVEIAGKLLNRLFNEGIIKIPIVSQLQTPIPSQEHTPRPSHELSPKLKQLNELVEINELGEVKPLVPPNAKDQPQQPQVDDQNQVKAPQDAQKGEQV